MESTKKQLPSLSARELEKENLTVGAPKKSAGGPGAVLSSMKHTQKELGLVRGTRTLLQLNQLDGFDCPGCAWPDPENHRSLVEFCENGAKAVAEEATLYRVDPDFFKAWSIPKLLEQTDYWLGKQGRLTHPMFKKKGSAHYEAISWEDAFQRIGQKLRSLNSPDEAAFYTSGRTSNEAAFLYQLFIRLYGTNNLPDCSNMCHESSGVALKNTLGIGKGTVTLSDFEIADCILVLGQNPGTNHPRMLSALQKAARNGCAIISINPLAEAGLVRFKNPQEVGGWIGQGTPLAQLHLPVRLNGDVALLKGILKTMLEDLQYQPDRNFIESFTLGYDSFLEDLQRTSWESILKSSGVARELIRQAAALCARSKKMICCWAMGLTQHENAVANIQEVVNLLLLGGHIGRPGAGVCPVRGHSNVQGDRTMGIWEKPSEDFLAALEKEFGFTPPSKPGFDTVETIEALHEGKIKVFVAMGGNFASATPDESYTHAALSRCELSVQISTKLNRSHLVTGQEALILPCLGRTEIDLAGETAQYVSTENSMGVIQKSEGRLPPASNLLKSEVAVVCQLALATFEEDSTRSSAAIHSAAGRSVPWREMASNYDLIRDKIEKVVPGFENYAHRLRSLKSFALPNPVRDERKFLTPSGKAQFTVHPIPANQPAQGSYLLMTIRSHDQYNTTIYGLDDRYRGILGGRKVVFMNRQDMDSSGLKDGDRVTLQSESGQVNGYRVVTYSIPSQCIATYFPETNCLVSIRKKAYLSNTPVYKSAEVRVIKEG